MAMTMMVEPVRMTKEGSRLAEAVQDWRHDSLNGLGSFAKTSGDRAEQELEFGVDAIPTTKSESGLYRLQILKSGP